MKKVLVHPSGLEKKVKVGFSWTFLFFGLIVPITRGDFRNFFRIFLLSLITFGIYGVVSIWTYNRHYMESLMLKGYRTKEYLGEVARIKNDRS